MDYILYNGLIVDVINEQFVEKAVLIRNNKIEKIGFLKELEEKSTKFHRKIDLKNKLLLPGFNDIHTHFFEYAKLKLQVSLDYLKSMEDLRNTLIDYKNSMPKNIKWYSGRGWDQNNFEDAGKFNKYFLDKIFPSKPVYLYSKDYHTLICNSKALELAGIDSERSDPDGGRIGKFENGEPNGFLYENAAKEFEKIVPQIPDNVAKNILITALKKLYRLGLTGLHVMEKEKAFDYYKQLIEQGYLMRFCWHFPQEDLDKMINKGVTSYTGNELLKIGGVKLFMDGALGSHTAFMYDSYPNEPDNYGRLIIDERRLHNIIKKAAEHDIAVTIHSIGDRSCSIVIDTINKVHSETGKNLLQRIEHLQSIRFEDIPKIKSGNIFCSVQPIHIKLDVRNIKNLWPKAEEHTYPFKTMVDSGITLGMGSDAPVETINPFHGIYAALERKYLNNPKNESWMPEQKLSIWEALKGYTINAAIGANSEHCRGSVEEGKLADLVVIDDFRDKQNDFWLKATSQMTIINGEIVYNSLE